MHENTSLDLIQREIESIPREFNQTIEPFLFKRAHFDYVQHSASLLSYRGTS
jgi:hypothetical protein